MQHPARETRQLDDGEFDVRDQFQAGTLYDRAAAGRRARSQLRNVTAPQAAELELHIRRWRLEVRGAGTTDTTAAMDLAAAALLVLALADDGSLNDRTRDRVAAAVYPLRGQGTTVAILTGGTPAHAPPHFDFLHDFATAAGVGFLFPPPVKYRRERIAQSPPTRTAPQRRRCPPKAGTASPHPCRESAAD